MNRGRRLLIFFVVSGTFNLPFLIGHFLGAAKEWALVSIVLTIGIAFVVSMETHPESEHEDA